MLEKSYIRHWTITNTNMFSLQDPILELNTFSAVTGGCGEGGGKEGNTVERSTSGSMKESEAK